MNQEFTTPAPVESRPGDILHSPTPPPSPPIEPLPTGAGVFTVMENLLKSPAALFGRLAAGNHGPMMVKLVGAAIVCGFCYGMIVGSFSGGEQILLAAVKISAGLVFTALICFPSMYIFSCLGGANIKPGAAFGVLVTAITLTTLLLIGFAPIAWVFSQSTNSLGFMGFLHLALWMISLLFGLRLLDRGMKSFSIGNGSYLTIWSLIFILTSLQMMTVLRPLIGTSDDLLPKEKMFFLENWGKTLSARSP